MNNSVYQINKGINRPIEFRGLKGQYIWFFGGGVIALLFLFAILYATGLQPLACVGGILTAGGLMTRQLYRMSNTYGPNGLMKKLARRRVPRVIRVSSRHLFQCPAAYALPEGKNHSKASQATAK